MFPGNITPAHIARLGSNARSPLAATKLREFPVAPNIDASEGVKMMFAEMAQASPTPATAHGRGRGERLGRPAWLDCQRRRRADCKGGYAEGVEDAGRLARAGSAACYLRSKKTTLPEAINRFKSITWRQLVFLDSGYDGSKVGGNRCAPPSAHTTYKGHVCVRSHLCFRTNAGADPLSV